jgi:hypothetical protein
MAVVTYAKPSTFGVGMPQYPSSAAPITASDTDTFSTPVAVYVGSTGDVAVLPASGAAAVTFAAMPPGAMVPVMCRGVLATGTTAAQLVAVY